MRVQLPLETGAHLRTFKNILPRGSARGIVRPSQASKARRWVRLGQGLQDTLPALRVRCRIVCPSPVGHTCSAVCVCLKTYSSNILQLYLLYAHRSVQLVVGPRRAHMTRSAGLAYGAGAGCPHALHAVGGLSLAGAQGEVGGVPNATVYSDGGAKRMLARLPVHATVGTQISPSATRVPHSKVCPA